MCCFTPEAAIVRRVLVEVEANGSGRELFCFPFKTKKNEKTHPQVSWLWNRTRREKRGAKEEEETKRE